MPDINDYNKMLDIRGIKTGQGLVLGKIKTVSNGVNKRGDSHSFTVNMVKLMEIGKNRHPQLACLNQLSA